MTKDLTTSRIDRQNILNMAMLLAESEKARTLRQLMLDIYNAIRDAT